MSVNRLRSRKTFHPKDWIMDSGAFSEISIHGRYRHPVEEYANEIRRWASTGNLLAAVSQDYMCEAFILAKTKLTVADHQRLTIERYDELLRFNVGVYIIPVLQGYTPEDYVEHVRMYGDRLKHGMWVGVGSVCKRNGNPQSIISVLTAIKALRPDLRLHGFGLKTTALASPLVRERLESSDSLAWSRAARWESRNQNDWREAVLWAEKINGLL